MIVLILSIIGVLSFCLIRGGLYKTIFKTEINIFEDYLNAAIYGLCAGIISGEWPMAAFMAIGMFIGSSAQLGRYMEAVNREKETVGWGIKEMTKRGCQISVMIALAPAYMGYNDFCFSVFIIGLTQGILAFGLAEIFKKTGHNDILNNWTAYECVTGAALFSCLDFL